MATRLGVDTMNRKIDEQTIAEAVRRLQQAAPGASIILFGSHARGDHTPDSDLDFLVIEPVPPHYQEEAVRLRAELRPLRIPVDILVTDAKTYNDWADTPGTVYYEAKREGRVCHA